MFTEIQRYCEHLCNHNKHIYCIHVVNDVSCVIFPCLLHPSSGFLHDRTQWVSPVFNQTFTENSWLNLYLHLFILSSVCHVMSMTYLILQLTGYSDYCLTSLLVWKKKRFHLHRHFFILLFTVWHATLDNEIIIWSFDELKIVWNVLFLILLASLKKGSSLCICISSFYFLLFDMEMWNNELNYLVLDELTTNNCWNVLSVHITFLRKKKGWFNLYCISSLFLFSMWH